jgi:hypothetical protein
MILILTAAGSATERVTRLAPVERGIGEQHAHLLAGRHRSVRGTDGSEELLADRLVFAGDREIGSPGP